MLDIKLLLADDHPILLKGLVSFLKEKGYIHLFSANNGNEAWEIIQTEKPDIGILDIEMPGRTGLEILELCQKANISTKIILLSYHNEPEFIALARSKGVSGYLGKENTIREIDFCIRMVHQEGCYFPDDLAGDYMSAGKDIIRELNTLSPRERQVLGLIRHGNSNRSIAGQLEISLRTVEKHRDNIIIKLRINEKKTTIARWVVKNNVLLDEVLQQKE